MPWHPYLAFGDPMTTFNLQPTYPSASIRQQEHEIKKLEQQLEAHRAAEELKAEEAEFRRLQDRIAELQVRFVV